MEEGEPGASATITIPMLRTVTSHCRLGGLMESQVCQAVSVGRQLDQAASTDRAVGPQPHQAASTDHSGGHQLHQTASTDRLAVYPKHQVCQAT